jgi:hypothetical protein
LGAHCRHIDACRDSRAASAVTVMVQVVTRLVTSPIMPTQEK